MFTYCQQTLRYCVAWNLFGCPIYLTHNGSPNWIMMTCHLFSIRDMSTIECRPPHLYECLWCHYFRTRNIVTLPSPVYLCCLRVVTNHHPFWRPFTDRVYWTYVPQSAKIIPTKKCTPLVKLYINNHLKYLAIGAINFKRFWSETKLKAYAWSGTIYSTTTGGDVIAID